MHRFYVSQDQSDGSVAILSPEDAHHAARVLRLRPGDKVELLIGGSRFQGEILSLSDENVSARILDALPSTEPALSVTLFQGIPKGEKMDWIVQKSVEIGVARIVPVVFSRCVVRLDHKDARKKQERWQKIAREAGKQSGRCVIPEVSLPLSLDQLTAEIPSLDCVAVPWEECRSGGPLSFVEKHPSLSSLGIVIGPEGGIAGQEMDFLLDHGCEPLTLGKRILRTETAGLVALGAFYALYGEMEWA